MDSQEKPDSGWKMPVATIASAIIAVLGTIYAAQIGVIKPTEAQVSKSDQFKEILETSQKQLLEIENLKRELASQASERKKNAQDAEQQRSRLAALEASQAAARSSSSMSNRPVEQVEQQVSREPMPSQTVQPTQASRRQVVLAQGKPIALWETTTVTLDYAKDYAKLIINGMNHRGLKVGSRIAIKAPSGQACAIEVMQLNGASIPGENLTFDLVCKQRT